MMTTAHGICARSQGAPGPIINVMALVLSGMLSRGAVVGVPFSLALSRTIAPTNAPQPEYRRTRKSTARTLAAV